MMNLGHFPKINNGILSQNNHKIINSLNKKIKKQKVIDKARKNDIY